jgi:hypothetical protein
MLNESYQVKALAEKLSNALISDSRNGSEFIHLKDNSPQWMTEVIRTVHGEKLPDDTTYAFISKCADAIADAEDANDAITSIEPDIYTHNLTAWLHSRADHVYYLTEVLEESEVKDGFQLLSAAQQKQIQEIGFALISALENVEVQS